MRSFVTTTRTSVSSGVGSPGLGDCWTSFSTGASRHTGSFNFPSRVIEAEESTTALALGSFVPAIQVEVTQKRMSEASQTHFFLLQRMGAVCVVCWSTNKLGWLVTLLIRPPLRIWWARRPVDAAAVGHF